MDFIFDNERLFVQQLDLVYVYDQEMDVLDVNVQKMDIGYVENHHQQQRKEIERQILGKNLVNNND
jgi:hypothetical protein